MQAFSGIRVLDFTHVYAGPFATYQLAIMGADVIKIEAPERPDQMRTEGVDESLNEQGLGTTYLFNNQGKRAMTLDLDSHEGRDIALRLVAGADVLVENYTHGLARLGLGPDQALAVNPRLVYCTMTGYGKDGAFAGRPAYDPVVQASSGMMSVNGDHEQEFIRVGPPLIDYGTGAQTAFAIATALFQREHSGKGQVIEVNMQDAALVMMSPLVSNAIHAGRTDPRSGNGSDQRPGYAVYRCRDDDLMVGAFTPDHHRRLFAALALEGELAVPTDFDHRWIRANGREIRRAIGECLQQREASEWETLLNAADIPAARVRDLHALLTDEQSGRDPASHHQRVNGNQIGTPIAAFRYAEDGPAFDPRCARHGEDTEAILAELGLGASEIAGLRENRVI